MGAAALGEGVALEVGVPVEVVKQRSRVSIITTVLGRLYTGYGRMRVEEVFTEAS